MGKRKSKEPAMGTSLGDLLFQKHLQCEEAPEQDGRVAQLQREKSVLEERIGLLEEQCGALERSRNTLLEETNRLDGLIKTLQEEKTSMASTLFARAIQELKNGNFLHVLGLLQAVLIFEPENLKAMVNLAVVYAELGFRDMAVEVLQGVLSKDPHNDIALRNRTILSDES